MAFSKGNRISKLVSWKKQYNYFILEPESYNINEYMEDGRYLTLYNIQGDINTIPVGSLEFVFNYIEKYYGKNRKNIKPINIPSELMINKYLKRGYYIANNKSEITFNNDKLLFIKSASQYKKFAEVVYERDINDLLDGSYFVSEVMDIESEWRSFVWNRKLVGLSCYDGDFTVFPDVGLIKEMIDKYKNAQISYTLDVGVNDGETFILECHPFVSCGLYGFSDYSILPQMMISGFNWFVG